MCQVGVPACYENSDQLSLRAPFPLGDAQLSPPPHIDLNCFRLVGYEGACLARASRLEFDARNQRRGWKGIFITYCARERGEEVKMVRLERCSPSNSLPFCRLVKSNSCLETHVGSSKRPRDESETNRRQISKVS